MCFKANEVCVNVRKPGVSGVLILMRCASGACAWMRCVRCAWMRCIRCADSNEVSGVLIPMRCVPGVLG